MVVLYLDVTAFLLTDQAQVQLILYISGTR